MYVFRNEFATLTTVSGMMYMYANVVVHSGYKLVCFFLFLYHTPEQIKYNTKIVPRIKLNLMTNTTNVHMFVHNFTTYM